MKPAILLLLLAPLLAQAPQQVELTDEPHHHLVLSNDQVRVFNVEVPPHADTLIHWHRHDYIYITLGDATVTNEVVGKPPAQVTLHDGQTAFAPPAPFAHRARNFSDKPFRNVTIELLQDAKLRTQKSPWDSDRGLDILHGGTAEILWVKDAVRATLFELQPGGVIPTHHHAGPHLVVALTDFELRIDNAGKAPVTLTQKSGETRWVPGDITDSITNTGHTPARLVTLEFPLAGR